MPKYVVLINFTEQGIRNIRDNPAIRKAQRERMQAMGLSREFYLTMGPYDAVAIVEAPDDESVAGQLLALGSQGNVRTVTMRAFTEEEADTIIGKLPPSQG